MFYGIHKRTFPYNGADVGPAPAIAVDREVRGTPIEHVVFRVVRAPYSFHLRAVLRTQVKTIPA